MLNISLSTLALHRRWIRMGFLIATLAIPMLTLLPFRTDGDSFIPHADKIAHVMMFGGWSLLLGLTLLAGSRRRMDETGGVLRSRVRIPFWILFICGTLFGAGIEVIQSMLPYGRVGDPADMAANALGALLAVVALGAMGHTNVEW